MAAGIAIVAGFALAAGTLAAGRLFARAAVRYRLLAFAFASAAAIGPLALAAAIVRPVSRTGVAGVALGARLDGFALPAFTVATAIAVALLFELVFDVVRLRRIKRDARPFGDVAVRRARIGVSATVATPTAIGYFHPAVIVPEGFRARVDDGEWDAVIAHECAHLVRRDDWAKAIQSAVLRAYWWSPGLWMLGRSLDLERELASDERAACETGPRRYAACLLRLATHRCDDALAPALWGRRSHVAIRVERLLRPSGHAAPFVRAAALGALSAAGLGAFALALTAVPSTSRSLPVAALPVEVAVTLPHPFHRPAGTPQTAARVIAARTAVRVRRTVAPAPHRAVEVRIAAVVSPSGPAAVRVVPRAIVASVVLPRPVEAAPLRREIRRAAPVRGVASANGLPAPDLLAVVRPHVRCATCFGPLRSPDGAYTPPTSSVSQAAPSTFPAGGSAPIVTITAIAPDDSGATDLRPGMLWIRIPRVSAP